MADVVVSFGGQDDGLRAAVAGIRGQIAGLSTSLSGLGQAIGFAAVAAAAVQAGRAIAGMVSDGLSLVQQTTEAAARLNVTTEALSRFQFAVESTGGSIGSANEALQKLQLNLGDAVTKGSGPAADALARLGLSADVLARSPLTTAAAAVAQRLTEVKDATDRANIAQDLFGRGWTEVAGALQGGAAGLAQAAAEADELGRTISSVDSKNVAEADDAFDKLAGTLEAVKIAMASELAPALAALSGMLSAALKPGGEFRDSLRTLGETMVSLGTVLAWLGRLFTAVWYGIQTALRTVIAGVMQMLTNLVHYFTEVMGTLVDVADAIGVPIPEALHETVRAMDGFSVSMQGWTNTSMALTKDAAEGFFEAGKAVVGMGPAAESSLPKVEARTKAVTEEVNALIDAADTAAKAIGPILSAKISVSNDGPIKGSGQTDAEKAMWASIDAQDKRRQQAAQAEAEQHATRMQQQRDEVQAIKERLAEEQLARQDAFAQNQARVNAERDTITAAYMSGALSAQEAQNQIYTVEAEGAARRAEIERQVQREKNAAMVSGTTDALGNLSSLMNTHSKKAFQVGKVAAIAEATINMLRAAQGSFAVGASIGGPILGAAFAATATAAGLANIQKIASTQFGGGGSGGGGTNAGSSGSGVNGTPTPAQAVNGARGAPREVNITLQGQHFDREAVRALIGSINEEVKDGAVLRVA